MNCGVYEISNSINRHRYIGSSVNVDRRWQDHKSQLRGGYHHSTYLQRAWNKYGEDNFKFNILFYAEKEHIHMFEQMALDKLSPKYNMSESANAPMLGRHHSMESRKKISEAAKGQVPWISGKHHSKDAIQKIKEAVTGNKNMLGKHHTDETKRKISTAKKGIALSEEHKQKLSAANKGEKNYMYGKHHTKETILKISKTIKGKR